MDTVMEVKSNHTKVHSLPNFVGCSLPGACRVVGFLNVLLIRLRSLLLAAALCFECTLVSVEKRMRRLNHDI